MEVLKFKNETRKAVGTRCILVGLNCTRSDLGITADNTSMDELAELVKTAGAEPVARMLQSKEAPDPGLFLGEGKAAELRLWVERMEAELVVFDNELGPVQMKNLEALLDCAVLDRTGIILDIFASRAQSAEGKLQVALAQYKYLLPRLIGMRKSLSRQTGTGGASPIGLRGPGETKLETDRRHIRERVTALSKELENIKKSRSTQRGLRLKNNVPVVALVGYTNAGKSTLLNALTDAGIHTGNRLFDTLDTTTRKLVFSDGFEVLVSDTVGFISKLPTELVDAFSATLDELRYASLVLHVADSSDKDVEAKMRVTEELANKLCAPGTPTVYVLTKTDLTELPFPDGVNRVSVSSVTGKGLDKLKDLIYKQLNARTVGFDELLPYSKASMLDKLYKLATLEQVEYENEGIHIVGRADPEVAGQLYKLLGKTVSAQSESEL